MGRAARWVERAGRAYQVVAANTVVVAVAAEKEMVKVVVE